MRLKQYMITEDAHTEFLETSACMGINPSKDFADACEGWLNATYKGTPADFMELIKKEFAKPFDWINGGPSQILALDVTTVPTPSKTVHMLSDVASLACGMMSFVKDKVKITNPYFVHGHIVKYYDTEKQVMGEMAASKANTADCIITSVPPEQLFTLMKQNKPSPDTNNVHVIVGDEMYYQVSLKKSRSAAQLGKISSYISQGLHVKTTLATSQKAVSASVNSGVNYNEQLKRFGIVNEGALWSKMTNIVSSVWDKVVSTISNLMSPLVTKFKKTFGLGITKDDLNDMAKAVGYSGPITEDILNDFNYNMLCEGGKSLRVNVYNENGRMYSTDGKKLLNASSQRLVEGIIKNPNGAIGLLNKVLTELETVIGNNSGPVVGNIRRINSITGEIKDEMIPSLAFFLVANYSSLKTFSDLIGSVDDIGVIVRRLVAEMFFGGTKLPLWKIYGASKSGEKSYEYLGTLETFQKNMEGPTTEILGIGVHPSETGMYYNLKVTMLEGIDAKSKHFIILRMGTNKGSGFSANIEGSNIQTIPLDKPLIKIL